MNESVAWRLAAPALTPEHSSPHCVAEWGSERIQRGKRTDLKILTVAMDLRSLFACPFHPPRAANLSLSKKVLMSLKKHIFR